MSNEIKSVEYGLEKIFEGAQDFLPLLGTDYVELYVGNAKQAAHFYKTAFGFQSLAYAGLETGVKDRASYVLKQDKIRLVLTTALNSNSPIGEHVKKHGDGVKVIALWVEDARKSYEETTKRGAKSYFEPMVEKDENGEITTIYATYDPKSKSGSGTEESLRKVKGTLHWVSAKHALPIEVRIYDRLFTTPQPDAEKEVDFMEFINPESLKVTQGFAEPSLKNAEIGHPYQFQRIGYFTKDRDSSNEKLVFNRTVTLKDGYKPE